MLVYPFNTITASELANVNASVIPDHIVGNDYGTYFVPEYLPDENKLNIAPGECWIQGRYWYMDATAEFTVDSSSICFFVIRLDITSGSPVFSIAVKSSETTDEAEGIYEILLCCLSKGTLFKYEYPRSDIEYLKTASEQPKPYNVGFVSSENCYLLSTAYGVPVRKEYSVLALVENGSAYSNITINMDPAVFDADAIYTMTIVRAGQYAPACTVNLPTSWGTSNNGLYQSFSFGSAEKGYEVVTLKWVRLKTNVFVWWVEDLGNAIIVEEETADA